MDYYLPWLLLVLISLSTAIGAFFWGLRNGQFSDQQRARYLPLRDFPLSEGIGPGNPAYPKMIVVSLLAVTAAILGATVYVILSRTIPG